MKEKSLPVSPSVLCLGRYLIATLSFAGWVAIGALHIPVDTLVPKASEVLFYPSFMFFAPLSVFYGKLLPWGHLATAIWIARLVLDLIVAAVICLPFLYPKGKRQDALALVSLAILAGYTIIAFYSYLMRSY